MKKTKEKLLEAATELFAKYGIDGVSTRDIVKYSGVNLCAVNYYFGSKQKLYEATFDQVIEEISSFVDNNQNAPLPNKEPLDPADELKAFLCKMIDFLCSNRITQSQAELFIKELVLPSAAYDRLYRNVFAPIFKRLASLIISMTDMSEYEAIIQLHCIIGQAIMFKIHKLVLLRRLNKEEYDDSLINDIKHQIVRNCDAMLKGDRS